MQTSFHDLFQAGDLFVEVSPALSAQPVGTASFVSTNRTYPATLFQPGDRTVKGARPEAHSGKPLDVSHHGVAMFVAIR
jgi:hypothetical protein